MYTVFTDFHHASLLQSFILLFEKRLGGKIYRPIGMEWAEQGFWKVYDHPATQAQYLSIGSTPKDGTAPLNEVEHEPKYESGFNDGYIDAYLCHDIDSDQTNRAITLDVFMNAKIDIVIASLPQHIEPFKKLCELHPNHPKLIYQIGNAWEVPAGVQVQNVMASAKLPNKPADINIIQYHQEFDTSIFKYSTNEGLLNISSFVNCFDVAGYMQHDYQLFKQVEESMPDWNFKVYGGQCRDGAAHGTVDLAAKMAASRFIWHTKAGGDGYGHIIHNAAAVGRPLLVKRQYYEGKLAESLLIDGQTCINVDNLSPFETKEKILFYSEPSRYQLLCQNVSDNFKSIVDFDKEAGEIQAFLSNLR